MYSFVVYLYVSRGGSITLVWEERANLYAVVYLLLCGFCSERFPLPLGAWDGLRYFIVALPEPSIYRLLLPVTVMWLPFKHLISKTYFGFLHMFMLKMFILFLSERMTSVFAYEQGCTHYRTTEYF